MRRASYQPLHTDDYELANVCGPKRYRGGPKKLDAETLRLAETLLLRGWRANKVSDALGFDNRMNFYRAFKQAHGKSPRVWADEHGASAKRDL